MTSSNIVQHFESVPLSRMRLSSHVVVRSGRKVRSVVAAMAAQHTGCAVVTEGARLAGILTERDVTNHVVRSPDVWDSPVDDFMTADPIVIGHDASASDALRLMNARRFRNLPVTDADGDLLGSINHYDLIRMAAAFLESQSELGPELSPDDFMTADPIVIGHDASASDALRLMNARRFRNLPVTDADGDLLGSINHYDLIRMAAAFLESQSELGPGSTTCTSWTSPACPPTSRCW